MKLFSTLPLLFFLSFTLSGVTNAQTQTADPDNAELYEFGSTITSEFLKSHMSALVHDSLRGRDTGTDGLKKAARYLSQYYQDLAVEPAGDEGSYYQFFNLNSTVTDSLVYNTYRIENGERVPVHQSVEKDGVRSDYIRMFGGSVPIEAEIVFAGFGVNDTERGVRHLEGDSLRGKWVMVFEEIPHVVNGDTLIDTRFDARSRLGTLLRNYGARGVLLISDMNENEFAELAETSAGMVSQPSNLRLSYRDQGASPQGFPFGYKQISPDLAAELLNVDGFEGLETLRMNLIENIREFRAEATGYSLEYTPYSGDKTIQTKNVIAFHEGGHPELKEEVVVLMAHYDHIGVGTPNDAGDGIYNGADDNGSGTTALMGIARALNQAAENGYRPDRSVLFLHVSAEEVGLLGSRYYSDHPVVPIEQTVAALNADMIGRSDTEHAATGDTDYVYLIGGEIISSQLDSLIADANSEEINLRLDRRYNDLTDSNQFYRRSDHWNFGRLGVPFAFYFTGVHEDYHQPSDHIEKIDFDKFPRVVRLIYNSTINIANFDGSPEVDNQQFIEITGVETR